MNIRVQFGMRLKYLRQKKGWSQEDLALESHVNKNYISDLENGRRNPTLEIMERLSIALGITLSELTKGLMSFNDY